MADEDNEQHPWLRPGFITAATIIALIITAGVIVTILNANRDNSDPAPTSTSQPTPPASPAEPAENETETSVCGLRGVELSGRLTSAPEAEWEYQGTIAYPTSPKFGPGAIDPTGFRYCFQHSPEGALFAATNAVTQGSDPTIAPMWIEYFLAASPNRDMLLGDRGGNYDSQGVRIEVAGFRLLAYDGKTASVDIAARTSSQGKTGIFSAIYNLVWENGDWKITVSDPNMAIDMAVIPDLAGYITWGYDGHR